MSFLLIQTPIKTGSFLSGLNSPYSGASSPRSPCSASSAIYLAANRAPPSTPVSPFNALDLEFTSVPEKLAQFRTTLQRSRGSFSMPLLNEDMFGINGASVASRRKSSVHGPPSSPGMHPRLLGIQCPPNSPLQFARRRQSAGDVLALASVKILME